eukprot:TRINITY_DN12585_c0_g1_i1.p1 TRINITY_DN12585_c0_g1~~TRINITY_DN12585_c0_g1_i1.p1  ORF type:complete len:216 (+),score=8.67 TRINITY_DN12585_c0_g1_i1:335-982(+)
MDERDFRTRQYGIVPPKKETQLYEYRVSFASVNGTVLEIAKNLVCMGIRHLSFCGDSSRETRPQEVESSFWYSDSPRLVKDVVEEALTKIDPTVQISWTNVPITDFLKMNKLVAIDMVVAVGTNLFSENLIEIDNLCRQSNIKFVAGTCTGLVFTVFADFGRNYQYLDTTGDHDQDYFKCEVKKIRLIEEGLYKIKTFHTYHPISSNHSRKAMLC